MHERLDVLDSYRALISIEVYWLLVQKNLIEISGNAMLKVFPDSSTKRTDSSVARKKNAKNRIILVFRVTKPQQITNEEKKRGKQRKNTCKHAQTLRKFVL